MHRFERINMHGVFHKPRHVLYSPWKELICLLGFILHYLEGICYVICHLTYLRAFPINVRFARAGEAFILFEARHARVSRFSKPTQPARAKRLQWIIAFRLHHFAPQGAKFLGNSPPFRKSAPL